jgi:pSer/pThr/pTyr-binding forkhead associated (FHA) protein
MASITVVSGPNQGDYYPLGSRTVVIGRDETATIQITDGRISRKHLQIRSEHGNHVALDLQSANGSYVNGRKITGDCILADGDEIHVGDSKISYTQAEFTDKQSAFEHWKKRGEKGKNTVQE